LSGLLVELKRWTAVHGFFMDTLNDKESCWVY